MENRFKMRISRMFRSSFGSCRTRKMSDVMEKAVFVPQNPKNLRKTQPLPPKARPFPSVCRPNCPDSTTPSINHCIVPRQKLSGRYPPFVAANANPFYREFGLKQQNNKNNKKNKKKTKKKRVYFEDGYWFSSEEEEEDGLDRDDDTETFFSSRTLASDSSAPRRRQCYSRKKYSSGRRKGGMTKSSEMGFLPLKGKVKGSFAVVKSSSDPYSDFRTSMVEMIVEKQIFSAKDLEQLLQCFLALNSRHLHKIIIEVFTEIWEALFSNCS